MSLRVELGGGTDGNRRAGFVNLDVLEHPDVDVVFDLEGVALGRARLPWGDGLVDELYSAHCLEHLSDHGPVLREVVRVCRAGAPVEFRFPHWLHPMAMCRTHKHVVSDRQVRDWTRRDRFDWFLGCARRLHLARVEYVKEVEFDEVRRHFGQLTDEQVMRFVPGCCHEVRYSFEVVANDA